MWNSQGEPQETDDYVRRWSLVVRFAIGGAQLLLLTCNSRVATGSAEKHEATGRQVLHKGEITVRCSLPLGVQIQPVQAKVTFFGFPKTFVRLQFKLEMRCMLHL